jgi:hypothetical protein
VCQTGRASWHIDGKAICGTCDFTADEETWNRLSTAADLLRSVGRLEAAWLGKSTCNEIQANRTPERTFEVDCVEYLGAAMRRASGSGDTLAAALIALAAEVSDA